MRIVNLHEDHAAIGTMAALQAGVVNAKGAMMPAGDPGIDVAHPRHVQRRGGPQVRKGMENPFRYQGNRIVLLEEMEVGSGVRDHSLHDIVRRHQIPEVILIRFEKAFPPGDTVEDDLVMDGVFGEHGDERDVVFRGKRKRMQGYLSQEEPGTHNDRNNERRDKEGTNRLVRHEGRKPLFDKAWHEHTGPVHIRFVALPVSCRHSPLFVFRQEVVEDKHDRKARQYDKPRPEDAHADTPHAKGEVLRMPDESIEPFVGYAPSEDLAEINLQRADQKRKTAGNEKDGAEDSYGDKKRGRRQNHVREEKRCQPSQGGIRIDKLENRIEYRVKKEGERTYHDRYFKCHDEEYYDTALRGKPRS